MTDMAIENDVFSIAQSLNCQELHFKYDKKTGLAAIVAIHNTNLGPSLGGCRFIEYPNTISAVQDVVRLAQGMTYKAAISQLPLGGGKAVIMYPKNLTNRAELFHAFGDFVESLNGRYITAMDSGTSLEDMDEIAKRTNYIASYSTQNDGDPSPYTAQGVFYGIKAAVKYKWGRDDLENLTIAVQGLGHVGYALCKLLFDSGAKLIVSDINTDLVSQATAEFNAITSTCEEILYQPCDVLSPCALGAVIHQENINQIKAPIIAGSANNQLDCANTGELLHQKGILYAPDYMVNAGGLIYACHLYNQNTPEETNNKIKEIYNTLLNIFSRSDKKNLPTSVIADEMAKEIFEK